MGSSVYKVQFFKSSYQLSEEYEKLSEHEKEKISELEAEGFFDYDDDKERYTIYVITTSNDINSYLSILGNNFIKYKISDLSNDLLKNKVNLEIDLASQINTLNSIKYSFFIDDINNWIYQNLDIDMILDRISEVGMSSLREVEKEFLKEYKG
jgi:hypothetical protein